MTDEQRLDRMERIVKLMIKAGLRARQQAREQNEKINILIDSQIRTDARLAALGESTDRRFAEVAAAQKITEQKVQSLADTVDRIISERRGGQT
ncbi:MAG: hypothetical protein JOZ02_17995 [Acidobacteria bacterium]|nr:hypothetical protein [Acidobacteriota bacterium]